MKTKQWGTGDKLSTAPSSSVLPVPRAGRGIGSEVTSARVCSLMGDTRKQGDGKQSQKKENATLEQAERGKGQAWNCRLWGVSAATGNTGTAWRRESSCSLHQGPRQRATPLSPSEAMQPRVRCFLEQRVLFMPSSLSWLGPLLALTPLVTARRDHTNPSLGIAATVWQKFPDFRSWFPATQAGTEAVGTQLHSRSLGNSH